MEVILNPNETNLEALLAGRDDNLELIETPTPNEPAPVPNPDPTPSDPTPAPTPAPEPNEPAGNNPPANEGLTADDLAKEETPEPPAPEQPPATLEPEAQYIADNLPEITTRILQDGKPVDVNVKSWTQLPQDVEFASKRDELAFMNALTAQENKARELQATYQSNQQQTQAQAFEERENAAIRADLTKLQNENKLPKFKDNDSAGSPGDPATQEVQAVLDYMNKVNQEGLDSASKGGNYYHVTFEQAYNMMPQTKEAQAKNQRQAQEDTERQNKAGRVGAPSNNSGLNIQKPTVRQGITLDQIADRIENEW